MPNRRADFGVHTPPKPVARMMEDFIHLPAHGLRNDGRGMSPERFPGREPEDHLGGRVPRHHFEAQVPFEEVIVGAGLHALDRDLFADRARDDDERDIEVGFPEEGQRGQAIEIGEGVIGDDQAPFLPP